VERLVPTVVFEDRDGNLWVGGDGMARLSDTFVETVGRREGIPADEAWAVHQDPSGAVWVGTTTGLTRYLDSKTEVIRGFSQVRVLAFEDAPGGLLVGTSEGLYQVGAEGTTRLFKGEAVRAICAGPTGHSWFTPIRARRSVTVTNFIQRSRHFKAETSRY